MYDLKLFKFKTWNRKYFVNHSLRHAITSANKLMFYEHIRINIKRTLSDEKFIGRYKKRDSAKSFGKPTVAFALLNNFQ